MRKRTAIQSLFPPIRQQILAATLVQPDRWWYFSELANFLHRTPSSLQRELSSLVESGILKQRREGARVYFKAETASSIYSALRSLLEKTVGLAPTIQQVLKPLAGGIVCAFIYGSVARMEEHTSSDVDLIVMGEMGLADLAPVLRKAENRLGREVNATSYSAAEFRKKVAAGDHFLATVLRGPKYFVKGSQYELDQIIGETRGSKA
jgi:predicted nucleotidyltransferase